MVKLSAPYPSGLLAFSVILALYKALILSLEMTGSPAVSAWLFALDLSFLALLALLGLLHCYLGNALARLLVRILQAVSAGFYLVHSFVLLELDEPMRFFDLARYLPETAVVGSFFNVLTISAVLGFAVMMFINLRLNKRVLTWAGAITVVLLLTGLLAESASPAQLHKYGLLKLNAFAQQVVNRQAVASYSSQQAGFYAAAGPAPVEFVRPEPDIILLIMESLSSINSHRVSGERDLLSGFDRLSEKGVLFINFFGNHSASEGGGSHCPAQRISAAALSHCDAADVR